MKVSSVYKHLPWYVLGAGGIGLLLRLWLLSSTDEKGFLVANPTAQTLLWVLAITVPTALFFLTRELGEGKKYSFNFPASMTGAIGTGAAAGAISIHSIVGLFTSTAAVDTVCAVLGIISGLALGLAAWCRYLGRRPNFLLHVMVTIHIMFRLICQYRQWSSDPQILDYSFQIIATIFLMLAAYHRGCFDNDMGDRRNYAFFALSTLFFCCLSLVRWADSLYYLCIGAWMITDLCSLKPMRRKGLFYREENK